MVSGSPCMQPAVAMSRHTSTRTHCEWRWVDLCTALPGVHGGKAQITHGEGFAVCCSRQKTHGKLFHGEPCFYSRQNYGHTAKLCCESILTHGKEKITNGGRRANGRVCRVSPCKYQCLPCVRVGHTANPNEKNPKSWNFLQPMGFKPMTSLSGFFALSHCTTLWLVFILHFGCSNIISNYV